MLLSRELQSLLDGPWVNPRWKSRFSAQLRADLEAFVQGQFLSLSLVPFGARNEYMALLDPPSDGIWDIRSRMPSPGLRVLGAFAEKDVFIAMLCAPRSVAVDVLHRPPLLNKDSREWRDSIQEVKSEWRRLLLTYPPVGGDNPNDVLSDKFYTV